MTEELHLPHLSVPDRPDVKGVDLDRDAALSPSANLADQSQDATIWRFDEFKGHHGQIVPGAPQVLPETKKLKRTPETLGKVRHGPLVVPVELELWIAKFQDRLSAHFAPHEPVEGLNGLTDKRQVLLRHRHAVSRGRVLLSKAAIPITQRHPGLQRGSES